MKNLEKIIIIVSFRPKMWFLPKKHITASLQSDNNWN